ncbi:nuclear transport factor 2 family protein [Sphingopyxis sp. XHP0097]|uniref:Nuclear transport factor 2 family protein n=1 Tax=Sphingopyxis jiangsuensis TaxID=2871171 RepID=A0ABS7MEH4_9SPHN|nr:MULTISPECIES: nuclear transport factor 2 family protein [Sphingopyxis]MBL0769529.1 nuclear transport factor 2 family protein [Sphingopyxis lutea]MBY4637363.1 nuclear transport factor 2 family protein [Sphingopyxis jiangsuensis]
MSATAGHAGLAAWHAYMEGRGDPQALRDLLAPDAVFHSPVVHTPQEGRDTVFAYLHAASHVLGGDNFRYLREIVDGDQAMLEFETEIDGIRINGVDIIRWDNSGKIADFKVMVRPLKAINKVWETMAKMLAAQAAKSG